MRRTWLKLEKQRGKMGMTWRSKVQGVVLALGILAVLALSGAADWINTAAFYFGF